MSAQTAQLQQYNTAINTFRTKYNNQIPGDISATDATAFGFALRSGTRAQGDGNRILEGVWAGMGCGRIEGAGETVMLWVDLSTAKMIDSNFNTASPSTSPAADVTGAALAAYLPPARLANGNYVYAWSGGSNSNCTIPLSDALNYFTISEVTMIQRSPTPGVVVANPGLTVAEAYALDSKTDDGYPQTGAIQAFYVMSNVIAWAAAAGHTGQWDTTATPGTSLTCFDNDNTGGKTQHYSMAISGGTNLNCALSMKFQ